MPKKPKRFDVIDYLTDEEDIKHYLESAIAEGDDEYLNKAHQNIAKARERNQQKNDSKVTREK